MLIGNGSIYNKNPMHQCGGPLLQNNYIHGRFPTVWWRARTFSKLHSRPEGTQPPYSWILAQKSGALVSRGDIVGVGELTGPGVSLGKALAVSLTGSGDITAAPLSLIIQLLSDISGGGELTGDIQSTLALAADLTGQGELDAALALIVQCTADLVGDGTLDGSTLRCDMYMSADITVSGDLVTAASCAAAVWNELLAGHLDPGSTGAALNAAGGAGDPWITTLPGGYTDAQAGAIMDKLLKLAKLTFYTK